MNVRPKNRKVVKILSAHPHARKHSTLGVSPRARRAVPWVVLLAVLAAAMGSITTAWACVPMAKLISLQPGPSGPSGSKVVVNGLGFEQSPVELRWNAPDGPRLGSARGPNFSAKVTIPKVRDGLYTLIALERQQDGSIGNAGSAPFEVTASGEARPSPGRATGTGDRPRTESLPSSQRSWDPPWLALAVAGIALIALGALGGALVPRFRRHET